MRGLKHISHVALFVPSLAGGGAERVMVNIAKGLINHGIMVDIVLAKAEGPYLSEVPNKARVFNLNVSRVLYSLPRLINYLREERPNALLSTLHHANIIAVWAKLLSGVPVKVLLREATVILKRYQETRNIKIRIMPWFISYFYNQADAVIAVSKEVAGGLKRLGVDEQKIKIIYNPTVTPEIFSKSNEPLMHPWFSSGEPPVILGVGRLTKEKDFATLIRAFALVQKSIPCRLLILGEGEERPYLEALARQLKVSDKIQLPGFMKNPFKYMKNAAVFVLSSKWEGLPNVLIEAIALGVPVVATNSSSGVVEILENGKWGKLVPVGDEKALAQAILEILNEPKSPSDYQAVYRFTMDTVIKQYEDLLLS